jgi:hypothetical protein
MGSGGEARKLAEKHALPPKFSPLRTRGSAAMTPLMFLQVLLHPLVMFLAGLLVALLGIFGLMMFHAAPNRSAAEVVEYESLLEKSPTAPFEPGTAAETAALGRFTAFLQGIGDEAFVRENTTKVYAADAYLDDTLVAHHGAAEIENYFVETSKVMTRYQLTINDVARSGADYYVRWTMMFAAPALSGGDAVHSVGISQIRFDPDGKVAFHQDFWDSGKNFFSHLPGAGGIIGYIRKRLESH